MSLPSVRLVVLAAAITMLACLAGAQRARADPVVMAAGDIACLGCSDWETSNLLVAQRGSADGLAGVLSLGDNQYPDGSLSDFMTYYDRSWGRVKNLIHPVPGNHDSGSGYYAYFGAAAGPKGKGYYSFDIGSWHLIALNSCYTSCTAGSPQQTWLREDLAAHPASCTLAFWHDMPAIEDKMSTLADDLDAAGADLVLGGHDHGWHRGSYKGMRTFTVGTGGADGPGTFGVMKLVLHADGYDWRFVGVSGKPGDSGSGKCRRSSVPPAADPPPPPLPPPDSDPAVWDDGEIAVAATADGSAKSTSKASNHSDGVTLDVDPQTRAFIRFDVNGIDGAVTGARLRLQSLQATSAGGDVFQVDPGWSESSLTWANAPPLGHTPVAGIGTIGKGPVDVALDPGLFAAGSGSYAFAIAGRDRRGASYSSREGRAAPMLLLSVLHPTVVSPPPPPEPAAVPPPAPAPAPRKPVVPRTSARPACRPARRARPASRRGGRKAARKRRGPQTFVAIASPSSKRPVRRRGAARVVVRCVKPAVKRRAVAPRKPRRHRSATRARAAGVVFLRRSGLALMRFVCTDPLLEHDQN